MYREKKRALGRKEVGKRDNCVLIGEKGGGERLFNPPYYD